MATKDVSIRIDEDVLAAIDKAAERHGETRTTYLLSWVPEAYEESRREPPRFRRPNRRERAKRGDTV